MWKTCAGRVQSVALKLIVDKEREIDGFIKEEYYTITGNFDLFSADLYQYNNEDIKIATKDECDAILNSLNNSFDIVSVDKKEKKKQSKMPFITSTLQQEASTKLNFNAKKTMQIAQKLYEGMDIGDETVGLIT